MDEAQRHRGFRSRGLPPKRYANHSASTTLCKEGSHASSTPNFPTSHLPTFPSSHLPTFRPSRRCAGLRGVSIVRRIERRRSAKTGVSHITQRLMADGRGRRLRVSLSNALTPLGQGDLSAASRSQGTRSASCYRRIPMQPTSKSSLAAPCPGWPPSSTHPTQRAIRHPVPQLPAPTRHCGAREGVLLPTRRSRVAPNIPPPLPVYPPGGTSDSTISPPSRFPLSSAPLN
jgi:hypothetical protein